MSNSPIVRLTAPYCNGLAVSWTSNTKLGVAVGSCSDKDNVFDITLRTALTIDTAVVGVNGMDTGTLAASTVYYIHLIGDYMNSKPTAAVVSLSATSPLLPVGYETSRLIGCAVTDGSTHFLLIYETGSGLNRLFTFDEPLSILSGGTQTAFTAIDLHTKIPALDNIPVNVQMAFTPNAASDTANIRTGGSSATTGCRMVGQVAAVVAQEEMLVVSKLVTAVPTIEYKVSAGALTALLVSFAMSL
jgi:hypothetical protein